ncbi:MAG TPA: WecB/TagA/CpsF family glycosyltransferase [Anaerolineales bacterium]|nr:WecB/TagA/CpsF family glycosyltransferase [Anaerolineales bacterium]
MPKVDILGVQVDNIGVEFLIEEIDQKISSDERFLVSHVNVTGLNLAYQQTWLKDFYNRCDRVYCDGMGVILGARLLGMDISERFTLADWVWKLAERFSKTGASIFLLGSEPGVANRASQQLMARFPELRICGRIHGFFEKGKQHPENIEVVKKVNESGADLLLVGLGMPLQEKWLEENWQDLNVRVAITCGALLEYVSGDLRRGPRWMTENYLEWLARILLSPKRYTIRYLRDIPLFIFRVLKQRMVQKKDDPYKKSDLFRR